MNSNFSPYFTAFILVFLSGLLWSFGPVVVRNMVNSHEYVFQYLFLRGISIACILITYLFIREGFSFYKNFFNIGIPGILGGLFLSTAFIGFIFSITMTTAAVTLFMLAAMPFIAAIVGYFVLGEILRRSTLVSMVIAFIGVLSALMALLLERGKEFATLRATGMTPIQIVKLILGQTALMGIFAGLLAIPLGLIMSDVLIDVINKRSFGWSMQHFFPLSVLGDAMILAIVAALLAGLYPAFKSARISPALALREE